MCADVMTCRLRYSPVVTKGLCGTERIVAGDPHSIVAGEETTVVTASRGR